MIRADQVPKKVVDAAIEAWKKDNQSFRPNAETIAAALNAWPNAKPAWFLPQGKVYILPAPWENKKSEVVNE